MSAYLLIDDFGTSGYRKVRSLSATVHSDRAAGVQKLNTSPDATVTTDLGHLSNEWTPATDATVTTDDTHCNTLANPYSSRTNSNAPSPPSEKGPGALPF